jgi:hypothetical protein
MCRHWCSRDGYRRLALSHLRLEPHPPRHHRACGCAQPVSVALYRLFRMGCRFPGQETAPGMGCVGPRPRRAGPVGHKPRTPGPAGWGAWAPGPVERGLWVTSPERPRRPARLAAACQTMNVASTTRQRLGPTGRLGDLAKMALFVRVSHSLVGECGYWRNLERIRADGTGGSRVTWLCLSV